MIWTFLFSIIFGAFIMFSFYFGVKIGQSTTAGEKVEIKGPIQAIKKHREIVQAKEDEELQNRIEEINLHNIDVYDGTGTGQEQF